MEQGINKGITFEHSFQMLTIEGKNTKQKACLPSNNKLLVFQNGMCILLHKCFLLLNWKLQNSRPLLFMQTSFDTSNTEY